MSRQPEEESVEQQSYHLVFYSCLKPDSPVLVGFLAGKGIQVTEAHQGKANLEETYLQRMEEDR